MAKEYPKTGRRRAATRPSGAATPSTGIIDDRDAAEFEKAVREHVRAATRSKAAAIAALKDMGYLTRTGKVSRRYR